MKSSELQSKSPELDNTIMFIPESLWKKEILYLPRDLNEVYYQRLEELNLLAMAKRFEGKAGGHGGQSQAETYKHFANLYANSASRIQCVLLNPHKVFKEISRDLILTLSSHRIALLDIPSGSGAGGIALLTTIKELRVAGVIPRTPLTVDIYAADYSQSALDLYESQIHLLSPRLSSAGISISICTRLWDATRLQETSDLIEDYLLHKSNEYLILMANFSGAGKSNFPVFKRSFEHMFVRLSHRHVKDVTLLWIEPETKSGLTYIQWLKELIAEYAGYRSKVDPDEKCLTCKYHWYQYVQYKTIPSDVAVHDYRRADRP